MSVLPLVFTSGWASGINAYAVIFLLGLFWPREDYRKHPGTATLEFLDPIPTGLPKDEFLARLEAVVEGKTAELIAETTGKPVTTAVQVPWPGEAEQKTKAGSE